MPTTLHNASSALSACTPSTAVRCSHMRSAARVDQQDAADVVAETLLVAWRRLDQVPARQQALMWLYGVARRVLARHGGQSASNPGAPRPIMRLCRCRGAFSRHGLSRPSCLPATLAAYLSPDRGSWFDVAWTAAAGSALTGCLAARRRAHPDNRAHWTLWSLAMAAWLLGQLAWNLFGVIGFPPSPNVADAGWWLCALLVMASMLRAPRAPGTVALIVALESTPMALAVTALCIAALWPLAAASHLSLAGRVSALTYPA